MSHRPARSTRIARIGFAAAVGVALLGGCATSGRVETLEKRVDGLESKIASVDQTAKSAASRADAAAADARAAAQRADDAARTAEAIFKKRIHK